MRKRISIIALIFTYIFILRLKDVGASLKLYSKRGFSPNYCYQHRAIRTCYIKSKKQLCSIEIFPKSPGSLVFLVEDNDYLLKNKNTTDFGLFSFRLIQTKSRNNKSRAKILLKSKISFKEWFRYKTENYNANRTKCPQ